jgi:hypothetical protein
LRVSVSRMSTGLLNGRLIAAPRGCLRYQHIRQATPSRRSVASAVASFRGRSVAAGLPWGCAAYLASPSRDSSQELRPVLRGQAVVALPRHHSVPGAHKT